MDYQAPQGSEQDFVQAVAAKLKEGLPSDSGQSLRHQGADLGLSPERTDQLLIQAVDQYVAGIAASLKYFEVSEARQRAAEALRVVPSKGALQGQQKEVSGASELKAALELDQNPTWIRVAILAVVVLVVFMTCSTMLKSKPKSAKPAPVLTEEEKRSEARFGTMPVPSEWDAITPEVLKYLKANLHDASSLEIVDCSPVFTMSSGWGQRVKYRARNTFGAKVLSNQIFIIVHGLVTDVEDFEER